MKAYMKLNFILMLLKIYFVTAFNNNNNKPIISYSVDFDSHYWKYNYQFDNSLSF
jgi:hypothetical protein